LQVTWHGHACVSLSVNDYVVVFDPHDGVSLGLKKPSIQGDLILVSHDHFDHNAVNVVAKKTSRVFKMFYGEAVVDKVKIEGLRTFHDKSKGKRRGENAVYVVTAGGMRVAHLGDLGDAPDDPTLNKLRGVDLLILPVGGTFTIEPDEAWRIVELTRPRNIMPIHYWIPGCALPLKPVEEFTKHVKDYNIVKLSTSTFNLKDYNKSVIIPAPP
jgi:L-ascorbate metabolism protein UlaG (beta-lactamase superfamily)